MTPERWAEVEAHLHEVLEAPASERDTRLDQLAARDPDLAAEVRSLLEAEANGPLGRDGPGPVDSGVGTVGPYRLLRRLGDGGMGTVFLAERERDGFRQRVALKLLRAGYVDSRFTDHAARERRILARMEHPNIARFIDGGTTDTGQSYLAMEYVEGATLLEHVADQALPIEARVRLMIAVCDAVHHAHQQLVIHRDLKPGNVMVGPDGHPRLLDFGVAKLLGPEDDSAGLTQSAPWLTPAYASPEQVRGEAVTTLSDVYSLGVVLYELVAGAKPYDLAGRGPAEWPGVITDTEPPKPSQRCTDPTSRRRLRGDLDTIILKAMAKEPGRRYGSAQQLADDLRRYLDGRPVLAQPDSIRYRAGKFIRRHRAAALVGVGALMLTAAGVASVAWQARIARTERDRAVQARQEAEDVTGYVIGLFDPPQGGGSVDTTVMRALLRRGIDQADALADQPLAQARMLDALGRVFERLNRVDQAESLYTRALELRTDEVTTHDPLLAESYTRLSAARRQRSRYPEALDLLERALALRLEAYGPRHPAVAATYRELGFLMPYLGRDEESVTYYRRALEIDRECLGKDDPMVAEDLTRIGVSLRRVGRMADGLALLEQALAERKRLFGPTHPVTAAARFPVADHLVVMNREAEAEAMYRAGIEALRREAPNRPVLVHGLGNLGSLLARQGHLDEAEALFREAMAVQAARAGTGSVDYATAGDQLAELLARRGRYEEALALRTRGLELYRAAFGEEHTTIAGSLGHVSEVLGHLNRLDESIAAARASIEMRVRLVGPTHVLVAHSYLRLAQALLAKGLLRAADSAGRHAVDLMSRGRSANHPDRKLAHAVFAQVLEAEGRREEAARHRALSGNERR